jgi:protein SCO1
MTSPTTDPIAEQTKSPAPRRPMRNNAAMLRQISRLIVVTLVVTVVVVLGVYTLVNRGQTSTPALKGTSLGGVPAPAFALTDQNGAQVTLASLRGHLVVLSFFYTHCPDECPLTASKFQRVLSQSGSQLHDVRWVAISTDPVGDTPATAAAFTTIHGLSGTLHYLLGTQAQLAPVWSAYSVAVENSSATQTAGHSGVVQHTGGVWLIDAQGREQVYLDSAFDPQTLADDLKALLKA